MTSNGEALAIGYDENFIGKLKYVTNADLDEVDMRTPDYRRGTFTISAHNTGVTCVKFTYNNKKIVTGGKNK